MVTSRKATYSDADILLADNVDFIPPKPIRQLSRTDDDSSSQSKKTTSVSFSLEDSKDGSVDQSQAKPSTTTEEAEKQAETKKNKVSGD